MFRAITSPWYTPVQQSLRSAIAGTTAGGTSTRMSQLVPGDFAPLSPKQGKDILHKYKQVEKSFFLS